jgi:hypothetical protein
METISIVMFHGWYLSQDLSNMEEESLNPDVQFIVMFTKAFLSCSSSYKWLLLY